MSNANRDDVASASPQPAMSRLLGGSRKSEQTAHEVYVGVKAVAESNPEDSGILEIQLTEETTSPEEPMSQKLTRTARKCKWCDNFARGASNLCARHGGGRRCHCGKLARGPSNLCMKHGGGRRCSLPTCDAAAVYKSDYCRSHGGGKRCSVEGCVASVYSAKETLCFKHGGGIRCGYDGCGRAPVGKTEYCIRHGGGKRCAVENCMKGAVCEGLCVKHHQDAYKLESPARSGNESSMALMLVSTDRVSIQEEQIVDYPTSGAEPNASDLAN
jgi:hypothetical protein